MAGGRELVRRSSTSVYYLHPDMSYCSFEGCAIVLDLAADRYWRVGPEAALALDWLQGRRSGPIRPQAWTGLQSLKLVSCDRLAQRHASIELEHPSRSALEQTAMSRWSWRDLSDTLTSLVVAHLALRRLSLKSIVLRLQDSGTTAASSPPDELGDLARRFARCRRLLPVRPRCLPDSLAFLRFASRRGYSAALVFGVEAYPFGAHCWAQSGDLVLTDALHHARGFSRILVV